MKKLMFVGAFALSFSSLFAQTLSLEKEEIQFGNIKLNTDVTSKIKVTNTGDKPLILKSVVGSCGCTAPEYPKTPIAPGASADITIKYSSGAVAGDFNKSVTITSNDPASSRKIFRVKGKAQ
ncbi:DUF1573 domain-containing protein [Empedobacter brevis]|uniref:DUF1573 domain-containing protein n=1 Tax=Empedobacter brevis TaxID=247 RepID=UPI0023F50F6E|nr:DUF1573 domain-containing protein [Empedobacter brevis]